MAFTVADFDAAGCALVRDGQPALAANFFRAAVAASDPLDPALLTSLCGALRLCYEREEAEAAIRAAIAIEPTPERLVVLAMTLNDQKKPEEAEAQAREAVRLFPDNPDAAGCLALLLYNRWFGEDESDALLDEALILSDRAVAGRPENPNFHACRLVVLQALSWHREWLESAEGLLARYESVNEFQMHRAFANLMGGNLRHGLPELAYASARFPGHDRTIVDQIPEWRPRDRRGPVTVWSRDGAGDIFQCARYFRMAADYGAELRVVAHESQRRLLTRVAGVKEVIPALTPEAQRATTPWDLASFFTTREDEIPTGPYLSADLDTIATWRDRLAGIPGYRVGVCWRGSPAQLNNRRRSFQVHDLAPLFDVPGISLVSLQKDYRDELAGTPIHDLGDEYQHGDWLETAGVIANLDLVISPCTGIAHLAGGMGKPVWLALNEPGCFRWMVGREDSPWYPSMRIFRQERRGSWAGVFERMAEALHNPLHNPSGG